MNSIGLKSLFVSVRQPRRPRPPRGRPAAPPQLKVEAFEERVVPSGTPLDLTTRGAAGEVNGALFRQFDARPTGTGFINSFVRLQAHNARAQLQHGFNTDARPLQFDENKSPQFTRSLRLADVPQVNLGGVLYREFLLDINQKSSQPYLSLDELRLYLGPTPNMTGYDGEAKTLGGYQALYDLDAGGSDNWVKLDYRLNSGSGSGDMLLYVPEAVFVAASANPYVYLYSKFGVHFTGNAGFEEWAAGSGAVTATGSISGTKFNDLNGNGARDAGEPGLADWTIYIDANGNGALDADEAYTNTDANGNYTFTNLAAGLGTYSTYRIREVQQEGWTQTTVDPGLIVLLIDGQHVTGVDFGNHQADGGPEEEEGPGPSPE